jgi:hypothetical protein
MDDTLLFLHVLSAFLLMSTVVILSALAFGAPVPSRGVFLANLLWDIGATGTIVFGLWIVAREDVYEIGDGWIIGAIVLWFAVSGIGVRARNELQPATAGGADDTQVLTQRGVVMHWARALLVIGFLVLMIWKPGA